MEEEEEGKWEINYPRERERGEGGKREAERDKKRRGESGMEGRNGCCLPSFALRPL